VQCMKLARTEDRSASIGKEVLGVGQWLPMRVEGPGAHVFAFVFDPERQWSLHRLKPRAGTCVDWRGNLKMRRALAHCSLKCVLVHPLLLPFVVIMELLLLSGAIWAVVDDRVPPACGLGLVVAAHRLEFLQVRGGSGASARANKRVRGDVGANRQISSRPNTHRVVTKGR
jgi:hypothetical protein